MTTLDYTFDDIAVRRGFERYDTYHRPNGPCHTGDMVLIQAYRIDMETLRRCIHCWDNPKQGRP